MLFRVLNSKKNSKSVRFITKGIFFYVSVVLTNDQRNMIDTDAKFKTCFQEVLGWGTHYSGSGFLMIPLQSLLM
jgi:hypothetical protein